MPQEPASPSSAIAGQRQIRYKSQLSTIVSHCWTKVNADLLIPDATRTGIALVSHCWTKADQVQEPAVNHGQPLLDSGTHSAPNPRCHKNRQSILVSHCWTKKDTSLEDSGATEASRIALVSQCWTKETCWPLGPRKPRKTTSKPRQPLLDKERCRPSQQSTIVSHC
jgi:hypothetical protein